MLLHWLLLLLAFALAVLGSLTVVKSPDWAPWRLAVLAGEYGHFLALWPLLVGAVAWFNRGPATAIAATTAALGVIAFCLLARPCVGAWRLARALPEKLGKQFGRAEATRAAFSFGALLGENVAPVRVETRKFSGDLALDFYPASAEPMAGKRAVGREKAPCVLVVHGGGWDAGDRTEIAHFNHWLAQRGYAVAAIDYRLAPKFTWPAPRADVLAAIAFLKTNAPALGIDATRLVLFGRSAGGNIAGVTAYTADDPAIRGLIALYSPADLHFAYTHGREDDVVKSPLLLRQFLGGPPDAAGANYNAASGYLHVSSKAPPTLLVHGELDPLTWHRQSERLAARLAEHGVPHALIQLPWATHACEYNLRGPSGQLTTFAVEWFLAAVTK